MAECYLCGGPAAWVYDSRRAELDGRPAQIRYYRCSPAPGGCGKEYETTEEVSGRPRQSAIPRGFSPRRAGGARAQRPSGWAEPVD